MSQDQRLEANQLLARARMTNRTAATVPNSIAHLITLFDMVIPALFPVADDDPCNCPQALDAEHRVARLYDALAIAMAHVERLKSAEDDRYQAEQTLVTVRAEANASVHREWERANAAEERADHLDRGHEVLAEDLAAAHVLTADLKRGIKVMADNRARAEADGIDSALKWSAAAGKLKSETARAHTAELCLARARAEWTSTRADLESANERLHERLRLLQRTCPGPSPAAQVMQPVTPLHRDEAVLDDPRMDGVYWHAATDVSVEMLHAWPFWERWTADSTDVLPCHQLDFGPGANTTHKLRPLRLPGMDASGDGCIAIDGGPTGVMMDSPRVASGLWQYEYCDESKWRDTFAGWPRPDRPVRRVRPAKWATLDTPAGNEPTE